jgi:hypothetical protein
MARALAGSRVNNDVQNKRPSPSDYFVRRLTWNILCSFPNREFPKKSFSCLARAFFLRLINLTFHFEAIKLDGFK